MLDEEFRAMTGQALMTLAQAPQVQSTHAGQITMIVIVVVGLLVLLVVRWIEGMMKRNREARRRGFPVIEPKKQNRGDRPCD
jgi:hypothetical protein